MLAKLLRQVYNNVVTSYRVENSLIFAEHFREKRHFRKFVNSYIFHVFRIRRLTGGAFRARISRELRFGLL